MPIPDYETLMLPLRRIAAAEKGHEVSLLVVIAELADEYKLTEEERKELLPNGGMFKFSSRVSWARTYLQKGGLLQATPRGLRDHGAGQRRPQGGYETEKVDADFFAGDIE